MITLGRRVLTISSPEWEGTAGRGRSEVDGRVVGFVGIHLDEPVSDSRDLLMSDLGASTTRAGQTQTPDDGPG